MRSSRILAIALAMMTMCCLSSLATAQQAHTPRLELPTVLGDHMVIQQGKPARFWGWSDPHTPVTVTLQNQTWTTTTDDMGGWRIDTAPIAPMVPADKPISVAITAGSGDHAATRTLEDVLVGEVWLCSGQSNMAMTLNQTDDWQAVATQADLPAIRLFVAQRVAQADPARDNAQGRWVICSPSTAPTYPAAALHFARELHRTLSTPIGLVQRDWGGTAILAWTAYDFIPPASRPALDADLAKARNVIQFIEHNDTHWASPSLDDADWKPIKLPLYFDYALYPAQYDGVLWARRSVDIPPAWQSKPLTLHLGKIDDYETTYFNGVQVGQTTRHTLIPRVYTVPAELVKAGRATLAVRVTKIGWGGLAGPADDMKIAPTDAGDQPPIPLAGEWRYQPAKLEFKGLASQLATSLYNGMIHPTKPLSLRGVLWYQGEADANPGDSRHYRQRLTTLIQNWRQDFEQEDLYFGIVQLANFRKPADNPGQPSDWAIVRQAQMDVARTIPRAGLASAVDIGQADDIHPRNKKDVGLRLANWALAMAYGKDTLISGPVVSHVAFEDGQAILTFDHIGQGLSTRDGKPPAHFALAGDDRRFHWAQARIEGNRVIVTSDKVASPAAVRYAWADNPASANLIGPGGLPALPFRSDDWR